jgi:parallel beta-helix repeat protein
MQGKPASIILLFLLLVSALVLAHNVQPVKASGTITINADGSINPPTAPISTLDNVTYTLVDNIIIIGELPYGSLGIIVERDNIIIDGDGYMVQGSGTTGYGFYCHNTNNVTIKRTNVNGWDQTAIRFDNANNTTIIDNIACNNDGNGIVSDGGQFNKILNNNVSYNGRMGIGAAHNRKLTIQLNTIENNGDGIQYGATESAILQNVISNNYGDGILFFGESDTIGSFNKIALNVIEGNQLGLEFLALLSPANDLLYHNNVTNNIQQFVIDESGGTWVNTWNKGYPSGGNYWSDYAGEDLYCGPYQNETGSDGIGDTPYVLDVNNVDHYPLMNPYIETHDVAVTRVLAAPSVVCQGYGCEIMVSVANTGDFVETFNVTVYANMTDTGNVTTIRTFPNVTLDSLDPMLPIFMWNTSGFDIGNYTISAYAMPVQGEMNIADNTFVDGTVEIIQGMTGGSGGRMPYMN